METNISEIFRAKEENTERFEEESKPELRSEFNRDRDRILYSKAFRRLSGKTQVFLTGKDDHIRNRLSHTLEVAQIARTITNALGLNESLTEAIALGHDIGHTPFGHVGERTLNFIMNGCDEIRDFKECLKEEQKGFKHNWQSIRVVTDLEYCRKEFSGLNLTKYTLWGILNHSKIEGKKCDYFDSNISRCILRRQDTECKMKDNMLKLGFYKKYENILDNRNVTVEGLIVALADEIAQRHHDVEDALVAHIIGYDELEKKIRECYGNYFRNDKEDEARLNDINEQENNDLKRIMLSSFLVNLITRSVITYLIDKLKTYPDKYVIKSSEEFEKKKLNDEFIKDLKRDINFEEKFREDDKKFQKYIWNRILHSHKAQCMDGKGNFIIRELYKAYLTNPQQLPDKTIKILFKNLKEESICVGIENKSVGELRDKLDELHSRVNKDYMAILMRTICDYISGMTDKFALEVYSDLYESKLL